MRHIKALTAALTLLLMAKSGTCLRIETKGRRYVNHVGTTVELPCTVRGDFDPYANIVIWYKVDGEQEHQINTMSTVNSPFSGTSRYSITINQTEEEGSKVVMFPLTITNVTLSENGSYKCELKHRDTFLASIGHMLTVPAPLEEFVFNSNITRVTNRTGTTFEFDELMPAYVTCRAVGGNPTPTLRMYRDNVEITGEFDKRVEAMIVGEPGLQFVRHEVTLVSNTFRATREQREQVLKCSAKFHRFTELRQNKQATIEVKYAPGFLCERHRAVLPSEQSYTLDCTLQSNPAVDAASIVWMIGEAGINLTSGQSAEGYNATSMIDSSTRDMKVFLHIQNITNSSYQTYNIQARNDVGVREYQIILSEAVVTTEPPTTELPTTVEIATPEQKSNNPGHAKPEAAASGGTAHFVITSLLLFPCFVSFMH